tara:strand:- start:13 stop:192 length:180 start_codon:yes stop_codon:yes gene_type:complete
MDKMKLLKEIHEEMNAMMHLKGNDTPSKSWENKYKFLERYSQYIKKKLQTNNGWILKKN